ncbi:MAG: hypothetical protein AMJ65_04310 [Phycisphaerae bacterium SG8_4]|nr:MAG: hypothetical protein AMJ65_04310 [Phycisphaerae bacterium SG8_4]
MLDGPSFSAETSAGNQKALSKPVCSVRLFQHEMPIPASTWIKKFAFLGIAGVNQRSSTGNLIRGDR